MGFISLITIDEYIEKSEKIILNEYGIKKEELQEMADLDFRSLMNRVIENCIDRQVCADMVCKWRLVKTHKGIEIEYDGGIDRYINNISKQYGNKKADGKINIFIDDMKKNIINMLVEICVFDNIDIWCQFYLLMKYTVMKNGKYDAYENGSYFTSVEINDLPFSTNDSKFPRFGREFQRNLYNENISVFSELYGRGNDITRYGFGIAQNLISNIEQSTYIKEQESNIEEFLLIDNILGVSLTNILFWYVKSAKKEEWEDIIKIAKTLGGIKSVVGRNLIGEIISIYMLATKFDSHIMNEISYFMKKNIVGFNRCFEDIERIHIIRIYDKRDQGGILALLEELILKSGYFVRNGELIQYSFFNMKKISDKLRVKKRIKVSKIKINIYELYASIHRAVIQGIVETYRGSAKK